MQRGLVSLEPVQVVVTLRITDRPASSATSASRVRSHDLDCPIAEGTATSLRGWTDWRPLAALNS